MKSIPLDRGSGIETALSEFGRGHFTANATLSCALISGEPGNPRRFNTKSAVAYRTHAYQGDDTAGAI
jgi:hypothetical protein